MNINGACGAGVCCDGECIHIHRDNFLSVDAEEAITPSSCFSYIAENK